MLGRPLCFAVAFALPATGSAAPPAADAPRARVSIDTSALGEAAAPVAAQIDEGASTIFEGNGLVRVEDGDAPEIAITVTPLGGGKPGYLTEWVVNHGGEAVDGSAGTRECSLCTESELVIDTQAAIEVVLATLSDLGKPTPEPAEPAAADPVGAADPSTGGSPTDDAPRKRGLSSLGKAGIAIAVIGGGTLIPGIVLAVLPPKPLPNAQRRTTTVPGAVVAGVGGAALLTGVALVITDVVRRKRAGTARLSPVVGPGYAGLSAVARF